MRTLLRISGGAVAAALVLLAAPLPASAGGPTSVLLASPTRGVAAALYNNDSEYQQLMSLVGNSPAQDKDAPNLKGGPGSDAVNITWLIHDVQVWRVDRVFVDGANGPWIETVVAMDGGSVWEKEGVVHRGDPGLVKLLTTMRLVGPDAASNQGVLAELAPAPAANAQTAPAAAPAEEPADVDWVWALAGVAVGAVLVIALGPLVRRRRSV
ncbi:MAG TPA: hypothetical protein VFV67_12975 [Actinophytocola sp.]|uniref:hypothetical protein n=1 Tax=Actinophytocola sp. TaxID=1872138 RepID=UPI002DBB2D02|nr:hypothetical protein [Actinophytocola sp.]HEU5471559.1 hypothetical protein [Actinophytocola sp.]